MADYNNHCIQIFTPEGQFLSLFGTERSGPGQLSGPVGIVIDDNTGNLIYIIERDNYRISIFTTNGNFLCSFGGLGSSVGQFHDPYGIIFDKEGYLYICDFENNRLICIEITM